MSESETLNSLIYGGGSPMNKNFVEKDNITPKIPSKDITSRNILAKI